MVSILERIIHPRFPVELLSKGRILSDLNDCAARMASRLSSHHRASRPFNFHWLLFTLLYGGAIAGGLWWVWTRGGRPFHPVWIIAPLAAVVTTDWTDHLIQLLQLRHCVPSNGERLETWVVQISNYATTVKVWLTLGLYVSLVGLAVKAVVRVCDRRLQLMPLNQP
jgi:hypothetical protein